MLYVGQLLRVVLEAACGKRAAQVLMRQKQ